MYLDKHESVATSAYEPFLFVVVVEMGERRWQSGCCSECCSGEGKYKRSAWKMKQHPNGRGQEIHEKK